MKRVFSLFTCLFIILTGFIFLKPAYAIKDFHMDIKSRQAGKKATYKFIFTIEKIVEVHSEIKLGFPQGTVIEPPIPPEDPERRERLTRIIESMSIGLSPCSACQGLPVIDFYDDGTMKSLKFNSHIELDPAKEGYSIITVTVPDVCGFMLPAKPGKYTYKISTHAESTEVSTQFEVVTSKIGDPTGIPDVMVDPPSPATEAKYIVSFNVGRGGWLKGMSGLIKVRFPEGTKMTKPASEFKPEWILVNKNPLAKTPNGTGTNINFTTPIEINDSDRITIEFDIRCGITNPLKAGKYVLEVGTSAEEWVKSHEYEITKTLATFKLSNNKTNRNAVYQLIYIQQKGVLKNGDQIQIRFPKEVQFSESINLHDNNVTINDVPLSALTHINGSYHYELIVGDVEVKEGDPVKVEFNCPEIRNPIQPGFIKLEYKPKGMADFIFSPVVEIVPQTIEITDVTITPPNALQKAKYSIKVIFGDNALPQKRITVYLEHLETIIDIEEVNIQEQAHEVILMDVDNGAKPGSYTMTVTTDQEQQGAEYSYTIFPPIPTTTITVEGKHGNRNWFVEPPMITFASSDPTAEIWVWWDKKIDQKILYTEAKPADVGQYKAQLFYQSVTAYGEEEPKVKEIWVDTLRPEIVIESPVESKTLVREKEFKIIGRETLIKTVVYGEDTPGYDKIVTINEEAVEVNLEDGYFSKVIELTEGENLIRIHAEDEAGNTWSNEPLIVLDTIMPAITLEPRKVLDPFIIGKTDPTAQLLINGEITYVEDDGSFRYDLGQVGLHEIMVVATDPVGNVNTQKFSLWYGYTVILQIGSKNATTNGVDLRLNVAPLIQKSKTLVPFRFIGEQLNATISYTTDPKTKLVKTVSYVLGNTTIVLTIGANKALVNGKSVPLDVPAQIMKGTTMVPLRFIAENLNCKVDWEPKAQLITITYPNNV